MTTRQLRLWVLLMAGACGMASATTGNPWRGMAEADLAAIHDTIAERHPGPVDTHNPEFAQWHEAGYREALARAAKAESFDDYEAAMRYYVNGFHDGHLGLSLDMQARSASWPGFVTAWRDGAIRVHAVADGMEAPRVGDALVACDGVAANDLYAQRVLPFHGNPEIASSRVRYVPRLFIDPVGAKVQLKSCAFRDAKGETHDVALSWRRTSMDGLATMLRNAGIGAAPTLGIHRIAGNGAWVSLPSFAVQGVALDAMKQTIAELPSVRDARYVVIDVRGNGGGSSHWGSQAIAGVYGAAYGKWLDDDANFRGADTYTEFRVSKATADHFRDELPRLAAGAGKDSVDYRYFDRIVAGLDAAVARGDQLLDDREVQRESFGTPADPGKAPAPQFNGRVYFLADAGCASACLDFADLLLCAPDVVHVGQPTSGDTVYMDVASMRLPSNAGSIGYATKVYRGRPRADNASYAPMFEWTGDMGDTAPLERWIAGLEANAPTPKRAPHCGR